MKPTKTPINNDNAEKIAEESLKKPYARIIIPEEDGGFFAEILEFPGCYAEGETKSEAFERLEDVAKSWIMAALEQGQDIPEPNVNHGYSGRIALRMPKGLHRQAAKIAQMERSSLNQFLVSAVAMRVGAENAVQHLSRWSALVFPDTIQVALTVASQGWPAVGSVKFSDPASKTLITIEP